MAIKTTEVNSISTVLARRGVRGLSRTGAVGRIPGRALHGVSLGTVGSAKAGFNGYRVSEVSAGPSFNGTSLGDLVMVVE